MSDVQNYAGIIGLVGFVAAAVVLGSDGFTLWEIAGASIMAGGAVIALIAVKPNLVIMIFQGPQEDCRLERATERDIPAIHTIAVHNFGPTVTPQDQIRSLVRRNRDIFWVLIMPTKRGLSYSVSGYICLMPLSEQLVGKLDANEFDITQVSVSDVPKSGEAIHAIYVGAVVGRTPRSKAQILGHVLEKSEHLAGRTTLRSIYARAASEDGLRLVTKHDFRPIRQDRCGVGSLFKRVIDVADHQAA